MSLGALVERHAQLEKRGVGFYRGLATRFASHATAARLWREMSNTEASHFALLELAQDWIAMAGGASSAPTDALDAVAARMSEIEAAAEAVDTTLEAAVALTADWEEIELPRILELVPHLPGKAQGLVLAGMVAESPEHYRILAELAKATDVPAVVERAAALAERARTALG